MKYIVHFKLYASTVVEVEAENEEAAREIAVDNFEAPCLCHHCSNDIDLSDEGEITEITALKDGAQ